MIFNQGWCVLQCLAFAVLSVQAQRWRTDDLPPEVNAAPNVLGERDDSPIRGALQSVAHGVEQFGLDMLHRVSKATDGSGRDIMISPYSIWSLLVLLLEGSAGRTNDQLHQSLRINVDIKTLRTVFRDWFSLLNVNTSTVEIGRLQALFTDSALPVSSVFTNELRNYDARLYPVNFGDRNTAHYINDETMKATQGLIQHTVSPQDLFGAKIFMLSSLFFKGQWKHPFDASVTQPQPFYNEEGAVVAQVQMMMQENTFPYATNITGLDGYVLELPYGTDDRFSMVIVLPKHQVSLHQVVGNLARIGISSILTKLAESRFRMPDDLVEVSLPKFETSTDFVLNSLLIDMGITDLFSSNSADLSKMAQGLFVNLVVHSTKIIVDEKGTTAAAATTAVIINKNLPPKFNLNKPFLYMIIDKRTELLLFTGLVRRPL